jgi:RNA polymerase sigma-70 factor (ECF subfamily)
MQPSALIVASPLGTALKSDENSTAVTDEELFLKARSGDQEALGELIGRYEQKLFGLLYRYVNSDRHCAEDLFQETFLHAMRAAGTFNSKKTFKPWITTIAINLARDAARKRQTRSEVSLEAGVEFGESRVSMLEAVAPEEGPFKQAERRDEEAVVHNALNKLTALEREVVLLHFFQEMTLTETAEVLKTPLGTIKSRLHAALTRLAGLLTDSSA